MSGGGPVHTRAPLAFSEFVALMATLTALVAVSVDMILPALPAIGTSLAVEHPNDNQLVIAFLFLGFGLGQMFYGPLSDSTGRKPAVYLGLGCYLGGCLLALFSSNFSMMLAGRFLQGLGVAGPRTITIALVRDRFEGREMARVMSFVMTIFILVPVIAPSLGQVVIALWGWRMIFAIYLAMGLAVGTWFALRQEETLKDERRIPFTLARMTAAIRGVVTTRLALGYTVATGFVFGAFMGWLNSAQQILQEQYDLGMRFPLYFALLAVSVGGASFLNASLVMRHGMRLLSTRSLTTVWGVSVGFLGISFFLGGHPPLWAMMAYLLLSFFCIGLLFSNLNAMAMQPLGHVAGTGAAVVGALATLMSLVFGTVIGQSYDGTVLPLVAGFALLSTFARVAMWWGEAGGERLADELQ